jgi:hypothetical protein
MASKKTKPQAKKAPAKKAPSKRAAAPKPAVATPKASDRDAYKVSPMRGMAIEDWIAQETTGWQRDVVRRVVDVVKRTVPDTTVSIKWAQPVFELNGPFAFIKPAKAHLSVGFWRGAELTDPKGILERGNRMGHFKLRGPSELNEKALAGLVKEAVRLNREKGSPTIR